MVDEQITTTAPCPSDTPHDISQLLGVSVRTVQRLAESGEIPSYRVGSQLRFDRGEVLAATRAADRRSA